MRRWTRDETTREDDAYHNKGVGETLLRGTLVNTRRREREKVCSGRTRRSRERRLPDLPPFIRKLFPRGEVDRSVSRKGGEEGKKADQRFGEKRAACEFSEGLVGCSTSGGEGQLARAFPVFLDGDRVESWDMRFVKRWTD